MRVDAGDAEQVGDERPRARAAGGDADLHRADEVDHVGDGEEVGGVAESGDDAELVLQPLARGCASSPDSATPPTSSPSPTWSTSSAGCCRCASPPAARARDRSSPTCSASRRRPHASRPSSASSAPLRQALPDIDIDVESARRTEIYTRIFERFGDDRVACLDGRPTACRRTPSAMSVPRSASRRRDRHHCQGVPAVAPATRRTHCASCPSCVPAAANETAARPAADSNGSACQRHLAQCGVPISGRETLLDRTPVESSAMGFAMSQFDKDDVEHLGSSSSTCWASACSRPWRTRSTRSPGRR